MTTTENDLTTSDDYELARRLNDSIDLHYVDARRRVKNYRQALDMAQGVVRPTGRLAAADQRALTAMQDVLNREVRPTEARTVPDMMRRVVADRRQQVSDGIDRWHEEILAEQAEEKAILRGER